MGKNTQLRKITIKAVIGGIVSTVVDDLEKKKEVELMRVYGVVSATKPGHSDIGSFVRFTGEFKAVNTLTGEISEANAMILPGFLEEQLYAACKPSEMPVTFGYIVSARYVKPRNPGDVNYMFLSQPMIPPKTSSVMVELESKIAPMLKVTPKK